MPETHNLAVDGNIAAHRVQQAETGLAELAFAAAHQTAHADDLARAHFQADIFQLFSRGGQIPDFQAHRPQLRPGRRV